MAVPTTRLFLNRVRLDQRIARLLEPVIGHNLKQIINQIHWKVPGSLGDFAWHQDSRSRRPASAYRNLAGSYVQTGLAIDPHMPESGCMRFIPRSHVRATSAWTARKSPWGGDARCGFGCSRPIDVGCGRPDPRTRRPGAVEPYLVHGSGTNPIGHQRRSTSTARRAPDCDRGEWAFREGRPVPFSRRPELVHYEELHERPGPHYV